jgi:hypothetical protein
MTAEAEQLEIECRFSPLLAGGAPGLFGSELFPLRIDCFGTHELNAGELCHRELIDSTSRHGETQFIFSLPTLSTASPSTTPYATLRAYTPAAVPVDTLANSTAIIFNLYCTTVTKHSEQACMTTAGTAVVPLAQLCSPSLVGSGGSGARSWLRFGVYQNGDTGSNSALRKGTVLVRCVPSSVVNRVWRALRPAGEFDIASSDEVARARNAELCSIIDRGMQPFFDPRHLVSSLATPTQPVLRPFHTPVYVTPRASLPSSAYATHMPASRPDPRYFERLLQVALERTWPGTTNAGGSLLHALELRDRGASRGVDTVVFAALGSLSVRLCTAYALSLCYLEDFTNRECGGKHSRQNDRAVGDEIFKIARLCGADDCEGVALETMMHVRELALLPPDAISPLLRRVVEFLAQYEPVLLLACVTNERSSAAKLNQSAALAHTVCALLHRNHVFYGGKLNQQPPVLFAEATAPIDPAMRPVESYGYAGAEQLEQAHRNVADRAEVTQSAVAALQANGAVYASVEAAPPLLRLDRSGGGAVGDYSNFYKHAVGFTSPRTAAAPTRELDFALLDSGKTYGVAANLLLDGDMDRVHIASILALTEHEARLCDAAMADLQPIPSLRAPDDSFDHEKHCAFGAHRIECDRRIGEALRGAEWREGDDNGGDATKQPVPLLHGRTTFLTTRERDVDQRLIGALANLRSTLPNLRFSRRWHTLCKAIDGTNAHSCTLDVYLHF